MEVPIKIIIPRYYAPKIKIYKKKKYTSVHWKKINQGGLSLVLLYTYSYSLSELKHSTNEYISSRVFTVRMKFLSSQEAVNSKSFRSGNLDSKQQVRFVAEIHFLKIVAFAPNL